MVPVTSTAPNPPAAGADPAIVAKGYVHPEVLVTTSWVADHLKDPKVRILESDEDVLLYDTGHIPGARHLPRGQLELRVDTELPDPTVRILTCCEFGKISTLAAATLRELGFLRVTALDGGMQAWRDAGYPLESGAGG